MRQPSTYIQQSHVHYSTATKTYIKIYLFSKFNAYHSSFSKEVCSNLRVHPYQTMFVKSQAVLTIFIGSQISYELYSKKALLLQSVNLRLNFLKLILNNLFKLCNASRLFLGILVIEIADPNSALKYVYMCTTNIQIKIFNKHLVNTYFISIQILGSQTAHHF